MPKRNSSVTETPGGYCGWPRDRRELYPCCLISAGRMLRNGAIKDGRGGNTRFDCRVRHNYAPLDYQRWLQMSYSLCRLAKSKFEPDMLRRLRVLASAGA